MQADSNRVFRDLSMACLQEAAPAAMKNSNHGTGFRVLSERERGQCASAEITVSKPVQGIVNVYDMNGRIVYTRQSDLR